MKENQIVDIDGWVHVVNGKVVCFTPDVFDLSNPSHVEHLTGLVDSLDDLYVSGIHSKEHGNDTMEIITKNLSDPNRRILSTADMQILSKDVLERIEAVRNEYQGRTGNPLSGL